MTTPTAAAQTNVTVRRGVKHRPTSTVCLLSSYLTTIAFSALAVHLLLPTTSETIELWGRENYTVNAGIAGAVLLCCALLAGGWSFLLHQGRKQADDSQPGMLIALGKIGMAGYIAIVVGCIVQLMFVAPDVVEHLIGGAKRVCPDAGELGLAPGTIAPPCDLSSPIDPYLLTFFLVGVSSFVLIFVYLGLVRISDS